MQFISLDHFVLVTHDVTACVKFYRDILGMEHCIGNGRHSLHFGKHKINIHTRPNEFSPAAQCPTVGSQDFCLIVQGDIHSLKAELESKGAIPLEGIVPRTGACGAMESLYLRDPDGNLVELAVYKEAIA